MTAVNHDLYNVEHQGWYARLVLGFQRKPLRTVLSKRLRQGPLSVQRAFYPEDDVCHIYLLHPPGGVVGGDRLDVDLTLDHHSHAFLTTPGAGKFYRSAGVTAIQHQNFTVADNACLEWMPQENIFFPGARVKSTLCLNLQGTAKAAIWDIQCFGRPVINEVFNEGFLDSHWTIYRDNKPLFIERLRVDSSSINGLSHLNHHPVNGTFIITNVDEELTEFLYGMTFSNAVEALAITLLGDLLVVRYLGNSTENARRYFTSIWQKTRQSVFHRNAIIPRIWNT